MSDRHPALETRGEYLKQIREVLDELKIISEVNPETPSERSAFRRHQIDYMSFLFFNLDHAIADYYNRFIKEKF